MATLSDSILITPTTSPLLAEDAATHCQEEPLGNYSTILGVTDMPQWEALLTIVTLSLLILLTIIGNILVILGVFTHKPLRIVQNFFIVSLAVADLTVAVLVLPLNVIYSVLGRWEFGIEVCKMWLTSDVLCCTASILNLCAIALDRFWAITDPINYAQKRTVKRVLAMIAGVWVLSLVISSPPLIGWNDWDLDKFEVKKECALTKRKGYVVYSSLGSFYIPLFIMTLVYVEIFIATKRRLRERAQASKINAISLNANKQTKHEVDNENESVSSETNHNEHPEIVVEPLSSTSGKRKKKRRKRHHHQNDNSAIKPEENQLTLAAPINEDSLTEEADNSSLSQRKNSLPSTSDLTANQVAKIKTAPPRQVTVEQKKPGLVYQFIEEKQRISLSKERRAARTLGIIMGVFVVCWLPFFLMYVITPFCDTCCPSRRMINFITWLGYINSVLNPIIYTIFNMDFRRAFRKLLGLKI